MTMSTYTTALTLQLSGQYSPMQYNYPSVLSTVTVLTDDAGALLATPSYGSRPAVSGDISDGVLAALNVALAGLNLVLTRTAGTPVASPLPAPAPPAVTSPVPAPWPHYN